MRNLLLLMLMLALGGNAVAQDAKALLQSGPMAGYSEMREVMLWVQTTEAATVQIAYRPQKGGEEFRTASYQTKAEEAFTAHLLADQVEPGLFYNADLYINGQKVSLDYPFHFQSQALWKHRTDPPDFKFIAGSCAYVNDPTFDRPGKPYGGQYEIWDHVNDADADFMVWLGDNLYFRESDWGTQRGIFYRHTYSRSQAYYQPLLAGMHHYAIWDDHDFGPNDADRSFVNKDLTLEAFKLFWANQRYGLPHMEGGITSKFTWGDCDFFLLDNRYFRAPNDRTTGDRTHFGEEQLNWLIDALKGSKAPFKFVCTGGMVLSTYARYENMSRVHPDERKQLMDAIQEERIKGVIFLTGDRHHTELSYWNPGGGVPVYDLTCSPLSSTSYDVDEDNEFLVKKTNVGDRNFGVLEVTGGNRDRKLTITIIDVKGKKRWTREISEKEWD